jgi:putative transcriptional regulator
MTEKDFIAELEADGLSADALAAPLTTLKPMKPPPALRSQLLAATSSGVRLERFTDMVAKALDVTVQVARDLLAGVDVEANFEPSPLPMLRLYHVEGGPRVANAITGFGRMKGGAIFPMHRHLGEETVIIVQGRYRDESGDVHGPGEVIVKQPGSTHSFEALPGPDFVYLVVIYDGLEVGGREYRADDPSW